ncbi:hypothetical protein TeGR_g2452 [Tetraparma gracilis]|uniref:Methyltransferase domain-containing protein n=1 Tax=Tetraparma gracilis TaxID=2962635 RepID=A0ABQ6N8W0_9STRA|nr:hypothetical protein TeGR_g2452 [Tetraparma gracilis]
MPAPPAASAASEIKRMQLYSSKSPSAPLSHEVYESLASLGHASPSTAAELPVEDVARFTCLNYTGSAGARSAASFLGLSPIVSCLDLGSGLGGPAIVFSSATGCEVTGVELQPDQAAVAKQLARACGVGNRVTFVAGDFLTVPPPRRHGALA